MDAAQLRVLITANAAQADATIARTAGMLGKSGALGLAALGAGTIMLATAGIATKMAGDFQKGITALATGAGEQAQYLPKVAEGIKKISLETGTSLSQLNAGMYMISSGGFTYMKGGLDILKAAAEGAKVGNADLGVVADTTDTILKNFGEHGALTASQAVNALITTVANGKTHLEDLGNSLSGVLPAGAAAGLGLKDVLGAMAELTNVGIPAAEAATYLRQMIIALEAPSSGAVKALKQVGISTDELAAHMKKGLPDALAFIENALETHGIKPGTAAYVKSLREISGGTRQMQGMLNLMGPHLSDFAEKVNKVGAASKTSGDKITGWALVQKNFNQQMDKFGTSLEVMMVNLGEKLLPVLTPFVSWLAGTALPAIQGFATWIRDHVVASFQEWTKQGGPLYGALKALPGVLEGIHHWFDLLGQVWRTQIMPNLGIFKFIAIVIGVVLLASVVAMVGAFLILVGVITAVVFIIAKLGQGIGWVIGHISHIGDLLGWLGDRFGDLFGAIGTFIGNVLGSIGKWRDQMIAHVVKMAHDFLAHIGQLKDDVIHHIETLVQINVAKILYFKDQVIKHIKELATNFMDALKGLPGKLLSLGEQLIKNIGQGIRNGAHFVSDALSNIPIIGGAYQQFNKIIPHFATGGMMSQSGLALVGENGPEVVYLPAGARVSPNYGSGGFSGGGAGGGTMTIVVPVQIDGREVARATLKNAPSLLRHATGNREF